MKKNKFYAFVFCFFICISLGFAKTSAEYIADGKNFETKKQWCHALGAYFDAISVDENNSTNAGDLFNKLAEQIHNGNPGFGDFNVFTLHDEWKKLLIEAEKWASAFCTFYVDTSEMQFSRGNINYATKTAEYKATGIQWGRLSRYKIIMGIISEGYIKAAKDDWTDMVRKFDWPELSVLDGLSGKCVDGVAHFNNNNSFAVLSHFTEKVKKVFHIAEGYGIKPIYYDSDEPIDNRLFGLYDFKFVIVDKNGKILATSQRWLLGESDVICFPSVSVDFWDGIDRGEVSVEISACYLEYGKYDGDLRDRSFVKNLPEIQIPLDSISKAQSYYSVDLPFELAEEKPRTPNIKWRNK